MKCVWHLILCTDFTRSLLPASPPLQASSVEEIPIHSYLAENPGKTPFMCHRIYDLTPLADSGLSVPSTPIAEGLRLHVEGLLKRRGEAPPPSA